MYHVSVAASSFSLPSSLKRVTFCYTKVPNARFAWELGWKKFTNKVSVAPTTNMYECTFCLLTFHSFLDFFQTLFWPRDKQHRGSTSCCLSLNLLTKILINACNRFFAIVIRCDSNVIQTWFKYDSKVIQSDSKLFFKTLFIKAINRYKNLEYKKWFKWNPNVTQTWFKRNEIQT